MDMCCVFLIFYYTVLSIHTLVVLLIEPPGTFGVGFSYFVFFLLVVILFSRAESGDYKVFPVFSFVFDSILISIDHW